VSIECLSFLCIYLSVCLSVHLSVSVCPVQLVIHSISSPCLSACVSVCPGGGNVSSVDVHWSTAVFPASSSADGTCQWVHITSLLVSHTCTHSSLSMMQLRHRSDYSVCCGMPVKMVSVQFLIFSPKITCLPWHCASSSHKTNVRLTILIMIYHYWDLLRSVQFILRLLVWYSSFGCIIRKVTVVSAVRSWITGSKDTKFLPEVEVLSALLMFPLAMLFSDWLWNYSAMNVGGINQLSANHTQTWLPWQSLLSNRKKKVRLVIGSQVSTMTTIWWKFDEINTAVW